MDQEIQPIVHRCDINQHKQSSVCYPIRLWSHRGMKRINVFSSRPRGYRPLIVVEEVAHRITDYIPDCIHGILYFGSLQSSSRIYRIFQLRCFSKDETTRNNKTISQRSSQRLIWSFQSAGDVLQLIQGNWRHSVFFHSICNNNNPLYIQHFSFHSVYTHTHRSAVANTVDSYAAENSPCMNYELA